MLIAPFLDRSNNDEQEAEIDEIFDSMKETRDNPGLINVREDDQILGSSQGPSLIKLVLMRSRGSTIKIISAKKSGLWQEL